MGRTIRGIAALLACAVALLACSTSLAAAIEVTIDPPALSEEGLVTLSVSVTNDSFHAMENISISGHGVTFEIDAPTLEPGATHVYTHEMFISTDLIGQTLTFTVTWTENGEERTAEAYAIVQMSNIALLTVTRTASKTDARAGETITLTYTIQNLGTVGANDVTLNDRAISNRPLVEGLTLEAGRIHEFDYEYTMGNATVVSEPVLTYRLDGEESEETYTGDQLTLGLVNAVLDVSVEQGMSTPDGVTFTLTITNDGNQRIRNIVVKDQDGEELNSEAFALAIGEQKVLTYTILPLETTNVYFRITGTTQSGLSYSDRTQTYTVREYVDPALIKIDFSAEITSQMNSEGSMEIVFTVANTGSMVFSNVTLGEELLGELHKLPSLSPGTVEIPLTVMVDEERVLNFTLQFEDRAGNVYSYKVSLSAQQPFDPDGPTPTPGGISIGQIEEEISHTLTNTLTTVFTVLVIMTLVAAAALIALTVAERVKRTKRRQRKDAGQPRKRTAQ
ncbi:MAG: hypothetical protein Q4B99_01935 [Clostridia bacterium]|nr:hypothetical protein [Clostridia bacterium]